MDALLGQLPDKRSRKLMQRAERRAQQVLQPAQSYKKGRHALRRACAAMAPAPPPSRSPTEQRHRGYQDSKPARLAPQARQVRKKGRIYGKQIAGHGEKKQMQRMYATPAEGQGRSGAGKQHSGWSAE